MDDLISRSVLLAEYDRVHVGIPGKARKLIEDAPSAQRKGKWLLVEYPDGYYHAECSECGQWADEDVYLKGKWNFCPNCGAEMTKGEEDETD